MIRPGSGAVPAFVTAPHAIDMAVAVEDFAFKVYEAIVEKIHPGETEEGGDPF